MEPTWSERLSYIYDILNFQLFELDGHGVSLGKLITGIVMLCLGYWLSSRASKAVDNRVLTRMNVEESLRFTLRRLLFYFFLCIATLFTLHALAVPITIFTVIGGALAVGIGFGSQNLVNNFISGLLVMLERPIRVGDYVEVDGVSGQVQSIGIRSTVMRTGLNAVTMIPNTVFIEKNLTNWTMSQQISSTVRVGVGYGTDTKRLAEMVIKTISEVDLVLNTPAPSVLFVDFGDNALIFDFQYFIESASFPVRKAIESTVRFRLNELFKQNKIDIPYPQRVVYTQQVSH